MAKRKTPKTEKVVDLNPKQERINKKELSKIQSLVNSLNKLQMEMGIMETRKHEVLHSVAGLRDELTLLQSEFEKDYGTFDINIQDGTINYPPENGETDKKD